MTWEDVLSLKYPEGARYIVKYLPTPDFDPEAPVGQPEYKDATVFKIWNLAFGHADHPGRLYAGTIPGGLFVSDDGGDSWELNRSLWNHDSRGGDLFAGDATSENRWGGTPASIDYGVFEPGVHSIIVDPRDSKHMHVAVSSAGVLKTTDGGETWEGRNRGVTNDYLPNPEARSTRSRPDSLITCSTSAARCVGMSNSVSMTPWWSIDRHSRIASRMTRPCTFFRH